MAEAFAIGFDLDHTLGIDRKLERTVALEMLGELARGKGVAYDGSAAERAIDEALARSRGGEAEIEMAIAGFLDGFVATGSSVLDVAGDFRERVVARAPEHVRPVDGAQAMLASLDAMGVRYAILTNGWSPLQEEKARLLDFRGPVYVSERINARKPAREAFDFLAKHLDAAAAQVWYVGDDPIVDIAGAAAAGLTTVWFDWEGHAYPPDLAAPNHTIKNLSELPTLLQGWTDAFANRKG